MRRAPGNPNPGDRPRLLPAHRDLARWTLEGGSSARAPWAWRAQLQWHAWWFERLAGRQASRQAYPHPQQLPVFVLGFWRSGTTLLHEWLAALPGYAAPLTWQCFNPASFLLTGPPARLSEAAGQKRPMDGGWIAPLSPQEDEFALLLQGAPSLYRGFVDPRRLGQLVSEVLDEAAGDKAWLTPWLGFLAGVEQQAGGARLVLKSPNHSFRLKILEQVFPGAPWVWVGRPAAAVWHSNLRMWRAMIDTYGLWSPPEGQLEAFLDDCMARYVTTLDWALGSLPDNRVQWVDFEELYTEPRALLQRLAEGLPQPEGQDWSAACLQGVLNARPVATAGTQVGDSSGPRSGLFAAYDAAHARARLRWRSPGR